ncbi:uncharacterized protein LOC111695523 [Eurytemora carolleeae]|uniref:uncharacterized protein LOC111695523 n=1 Tax=Eurytemora carolleeae TaxID=1294199 RepID=UPI000C77CB54|nr:uncharacterized protein LOC111695523 [Eurytemora carolleeae]|eukprot:XP_023320659.1 uncharacterized protein LOC111695523 [Eurytemora affinis]
MKRGWRVQWSVYLVLLVLCSPASLIRRTTGNYKPNQIFQKTREDGWKQNGAVRSWLRPDDGDEDTVLLRILSGGEEAGRVIGDINIGWVDSNVTNNIYPYLLKV